MNSDNTRISVEISRLEEFSRENRYKLDENERKSLELMIQLLNSIQKEIVNSKCNLGKLDIASVDINPAKDTTRIEHPSRKYKLNLKYDDIRILKIELSFYNDKKYHEFLQDLEDKAISEKNPMNAMRYYGKINFEKEKYEPGINVGIQWNKKNLGNKLQGYTNISSLIENRNIDAEKLKKIIRSIFLNNDCTIKEQGAKGCVESELKKEGQFDFCDFRFFLIDKYEMKIISAIIETIKFLMNLTYLLK